MDPVSAIGLAASLVSISDAGIKVFLGLSSVAEKVKHADQSVQFISNDVSATCGILSQLRELMGPKKDRHGQTFMIFKNDGLVALRSSANHCNCIFDQLQKALQKASKQISGVRSQDTKVMLSKSEKAKWPFYEPRILALRDELGAVKNNLMIALSIAHLAHSERLILKDDTSVLSAEEQNMYIDTVKRLTDHAEKPHQLSTKATSQSPKKTNALKVDHTKQLFVSLLGEFESPDRGVEDKKTLGDDCVVQSSAKREIRPADLKPDTLANRGLSDLKSPQPAAQLQPNSSAGTEATPTNSRMSTSSTLLSANPSLINFPDMDSSNAGSSVKSTLERRSSNSGSIPASGSVHSRTASDSGSPTLAAWTITAIHHANGHSWTIDPLPIAQPLIRQHMAEHQAIAPSVTLQLQKLNPLQQSKVLEHVRHTEGAELLSVGALSNQRMPSVLGWLEVDVLLWIMSTPQREEYRRPPESSAKPAEDSIAIADLDEHRSVVRRATESLEVTSLDLRSDVMADRLRRGPQPSKPSRRVGKRDTLSTAPISAGKEVEIALTLPRRQLRTNSFSQKPLPERHVSRKGRETSLNKAYRKVSKTLPSDEANTKTESPVETRNKLPSPPFKPEPISVPDYTGQIYNERSDWDNFVRRHHHPTRLSDVLEEDEKGRTSPSRASERSTKLSVSPGSEVHPDMLNTAGGPSPTLTPLVVRQDLHGITWLAFEYTRDGVKMEYTMRCDVENVEVEDLTHAFKQENCIYPQFYNAEFQYEGSTMLDKMHSNFLGWALADLNAMLRGKPDLIQHAVDNWCTYNKYPEEYNRKSQLRNPLMSTFPRSAVQIEDDAILDEEAESVIKAGKIQYRKADATKAPHQRRFSKACDMCRKKKMICDGKQPKCSACAKNRTDCVIPDSTSLAQILDAPSQESSNERPSSSSTNTAMTMDVKDTEIVIRRRSRSPSPVGSVPASDTASQPELKGSTQKMGAMDGRPEQIVEWRGPKDAWMSTDPATRSHFVTPPRLTEDELCLDTDPAGMDAFMEDPLAQELGWDALDAPNSWAVVATDADKNKEKVTEAISDHADSSMEHARPSIVSGPLIAQPLSSPPFDTYDIVEKRHVEVNSFADDHDTFADDVDQYRVSPMLTELVDPPALPQAEASDEVPAPAQAPREGMDQTVADLIAAWTTAYD